MKQELGDVTRRLTGTIKLGRIKAKLAGPQHPSTVRFRRIPYERRIDLNINQKVQAIWCT